MKFIEIIDLYKIYAEGEENEVRALNGVSLTIDKGEFVALVGASGSGKSTMMNILGCLDVPTYGEYILDGVPIKERNENELADIRSRHVGFVFQGYNLIPTLKVWENVALPLTYQNIKADEAYRRAMEALKQVDIVLKADNKPSQLSGGQQQRVAIARAIATRSLIIMADEPTGALDSKTGMQVIQTLRELNEQGTTVILITHDNNIAVKTKRIVRLHDGLIIEDQINPAWSSASPGIGVQQINPHLDTNAAAERGH